MKLFLFALTLIASQFIFAQNWHAIASGTDSKLNSIHFINRDVGYIGGNDSLLLKTTDAGKTWVKLSLNIGLGVSNAIIDVFFEDEMKGYVLIGPYGGLYKTLDGGMNWELDSAINNTNMCFKRSMHFTDFDNGYLGGSMCFQGETVTKMINSTWSPPQAIGSWNANDQITNFDFLNPQKGFAASSSHYIFKTTDAGVTWDSVSSSLDTLGTSDVVFINDTLAYATYPTAGSAGVLITTDGGNSWDIDMHAATFYYPGFNAVTKDANNTAYFGGFDSWGIGGVIFKKGISSFWNYDQVGHPINDIAVSTDSTVFAVGDSGLIVTNVILSNIGIDEPNASQFRVYPNPSSGTFKIESLGGGSISVFNALGTEVLEMESHNSIQEIDISSQADGVYFIHVKTAKASGILKVLKRD